jgi:hypothetical protein
LQKENSRRQRRRLSTVGALLIRNTILTRASEKTSQVSKANVFTSEMKWSDFTSKASRFFVKM